MQRVQHHALAVVEFQHRVRGRDVVLDQIADFGVVERQPRVDVHAVEVFERAADRMRELVAQGLQARFPPCIGFQRDQDVGLAFPDQGEQRPGIAIGHQHVAGEQPDTRMATRGILVLDFDRMQPGVGQDPPGLPQHAARVGGDDRHRPRIIDRMEHQLQHQHHRGRDDQLQAGEVATADPPHAAADRGQQRDDDEQDGQSGEDRSQHAASGRRKGERVFSFARNAVVNAGRVTRAAARRARRGDRRTRARAHRARSACRDHGVRTAAAGADGRAATGDGACGRT